MANEKKFIDLLALGLYDAKIKTYIGQQIEKASHLKFQKVDSLPPVAEADPATIYLVARGSAGQESSDVYNEFFLVDGKFELIGSTAVDFSNYFTKEEVNAALANKVDKVTNARLMTKEEIEKLDAIESGAQKNVQADWNATSGDAFIKNKPTLGTASSKDEGYFDKAGAASTVKAAVIGQSGDAKSADTIYGAKAHATDVAATAESNAKAYADNNFVKVNGTDRLMTADEGTKLAGIAAGAEVNVQADWFVVDPQSDAYIKNKPTLGTASSKNEDYFDKAGAAGEAEENAKAYADEVVSTAISASSAEGIIKATLGGTVLVPSITLTYSVAGEDDINALFVNDPITVLSDRVDELANS